MNTLLTLTQTGFIVLTLVMYWLLFRELKVAISKTSWDESRRKKIYNRALSAVIGWTVVISALSLAGFFNDFSTFPPRFVITLVVPLAVIIFVTFSKPMKDLLGQVPARKIIRMQTFRVFVEVLLWLLFIQNLMPVQMSFEGRNFDILAGLTAPFAAYALVNSKTGLVIWNVLCLGLLINIVTIAILSLPTPLRVFMNEPANTIVAVFPFVWLPALLVPLAYGLSFMSLRQVALRK